MVAVSSHAGIQHMSRQDVLDAAVALSVVTWEENSNLFLLSNLWVVSNVETRPEVSPVPSCFLSTNLGFSFSRLC